MRSHGKEVSTPVGEIRVEGKPLNLKGRPSLVLVGKPEDSTGYKCGPGVTLEGQTVVQNGHYWRRIDSFSAGGLPVSSVEDPDVRKIFTSFWSPSDLKI